MAGKMIAPIHNMLAINPVALPALRIAGTLFLIINLIGGTYIFLNRHRFFDQDSNVDNDIPAVRNLRMEVVMIPWLVLTTLLVILLIYLWLACEWSGVREPNAAAFLFRGLLLILRFETFDVGKSIEVAIKRSDGHGLGSGNSSVICIDKIHGGVCEKFQCIQQQRPVIDFNSSGFNDTFEGRSDGDPIERIERLPEPMQFQPTQRH